MNSHLLIIGLFGFTGIHHFMDKNYGKGILYLFTFGLFGFGWIFDFVKELKNASYEKSIMSKESKTMIKNGNLPNLYVENLMLFDGEKCHFTDVGYIYKDKSVVTGYKGSGAGFNVKISKGLSFRTGSSDKKVIRENQRITHKGIIYITTNRIIYNSAEFPIDVTFDKVTSLSKLKEGIMLQIGNKSYNITLKNPDLFMIVFSIIRNNK